MAKSKPTNKEQTADVHKTGATATRERAALWRWKGFIKNDDRDVVEVIAEARARRGRI